MTQYSTDVQEPIAPLEADAACPECAHPRGSERITRGGRLRGTKALRCCHVTVVQDALVDDSEVCHCEHAWHTESERA
ncbi:hypothetical protein SEA_GEAZY_31 [Gordonia phage GEazy]|nr:hypothetical protein SEA_GEAZY_31 [Gordonia phage GEazy]